MRRDRKDYRRDSHETQNPKVWLGIVLVAIGGYFLLRNFDMIPSFLPYWVFSWEMIFVVIGGSMLVTGRREGLVFLAIGTLFLLPDIFYLPHFHMRDWWPLILIIIGVSIFLRRRSYSEPSPGDTNNEFFNDTSIFGGSEKTITSQNLKGGRITSLFGGSELNMLGVNLGQNEVVIDYFCMFGGNEITVPNDWTVVNEMFVIFGGFSDKRAKVSGVQQDPEKVIRLKGFVMFGGSEVRGG